ncbi:flagellar basal body rod protein FlgB [Rhizobium metallidurans]|uniref:Flagellar basal-body rod protein FlgB n=1 Tax=Rhizobium metallidurans TaxID=1265931 RepID=A0A7W6CR17_9HYPH|nr:flagellar basal body rod protein FlgB [Rhizobium metallidurans]MBB3964619.1 flagellar basal-body rod protein FlgB [Rhizobium metallidurans]
MQPIQLFDLASRQAEWLTIRQEVVAGNIANANTPKYRAQDITPFQAVLDRSDITMARTNAAHLSGNNLNTKNDINVRDADLNQEMGVQESGNTVGLAKELSKSGEIKRQYELNTSLVGSFNRMMLMTVKS